MSDPSERITHTTDSDCTVVDDECVVCGVGHGDPCPTCGRRAFHVEGCPEVYDLSEHAWSQFPVRCACCQRTYEGPKEYEQKTTAPGSSGRSVAEQGGVLMWLRNCACGGTMAVEMEKPPAE